jgi:hypothetical protein
VPRSHKPASLLDWNVHAPLGQKIVQRHKVKIVEVAPRLRTLVDLGENRPVPRAPGVSEFLRIARDPAGTKRLRDPGAPVHEGPEDVEGERSDGHRARAR